MGECFVNIHVLKTANEPNEWHNIAFLQPQAES